MPEHDPTTVDALLARDGSEFVEAAYRALLRRQSDEQGRAHYLRQLQAGTAKTEILVQIATSPEGRVAGARMAGLERWISRYQTAAVPVVGRLFARELWADRKSPQARQMRVLEQTLYTVRCELRESRLEQQALADRLTQTLGTAVDKLGQAQHSAFIQLSKLVVQTGKTVDARIDLLERQVSGDVARIAEAASRPAAHAQAAADPQRPAAPADAQPSDRPNNQGPLGKLRATLAQLRERGHA